MCWSNQLGLLMFEMKAFQFCLAKFSGLVFDYCLLFSRSKLKVEDLKEAQLMAKDAQWTEDKEATHCRQCVKMFSVSRRKVGMVYFLMSYPFGIHLHVYQ